MLLFLVHDKDDEKRHITGIFDGDGVAVTVT
jgi:hypothetical protein